MTTRAVSVVAADDYSLRNYSDNIAVDPALGAARAIDDLFYYNDSLMSAMLALLRESRATRTIRDLRFRARIYCVASTV